MVSAHRALTIKINGNEYLTSVDEQCHIMSAQGPGTSSEVADGTAIAGTQFGLEVANPQNQAGSFLNQRNRRLALPLSRMIGALVTAEGAAGLFQVAATSGNVINPTQSRTGTPVTRAPAQLYPPSYAATVAGTVVVTHMQCPKPRRLASSTSEIAAPYSHS